MLNIINSEHPVSRKLSRGAVCDALGVAVDRSDGGVSLATRRKFAPPAGLCEALNDPIVAALMVADGTDREHVATLMRCVAARQMVDRIFQKGAYP